MRLAAKLLNKNLKGVILYGTDGIKTGLALSLYETKSKIKILDGVSLNVFSGNDYNVGLGIEKKVIDVNKIFNVGVGVYATRPVNNFFNKNTKTSLNIGLSGTWKF